MNCGTEVVRRASLENNKRTRSWCARLYQGCFVLSYTAFLRPPVYCVKGNKFEGAGQYDESRLFA